MSDHIVVHDISINPCEDKNSLVPVYQVKIDYNVRDNSSCQMIFKTVNSHFTQWLVKQKIINWRKLIQLIGSEQYVT